MLNNLSVLAITGDDAAAFLQGQTTCDVNEINENKTGCGAFCNAKGRVISTFILLKAEKGFLLVLSLIHI